MKKKIVLLLLISSWLGAVGYILFQNKVAKTEVTPIADLQKDLIDSATRLKSWYYEGDWDEHFSSNKTSCPDLLADKDKADPWYYRCNKDFLECVLKSKNGLIKKTKGFSIQAVKNKQGLYTKTINRSTVLQKRAPESSIGITLTITELGHEIDLSIESDCHTTYLPKRIYSYFKNPNKVEDLGPENQYLWDNFFSHIYVDKFQVRWRDVKDWMDSNSEVVIKSFPKEVEKYHESATSLTIEQMEQYCAFHGKQVLPSYIFDAATVLPGDIENNKDLYVKHYFYPWTIRSTDPLISNLKNDDFSLAKGDCHKIFAKECAEKYSFKEWTMGLSSWLELRQVLGGHLEYLPNPLFPRQNIKASSSLFELSSPWHKLGLRSFWDRGKLSWDYPDGKRGRVRSFAPLQENNQIAFRCMKYGQ